MPNSSVCFISGLCSGIIFYGLVYFVGLQYFHWPVQRVLGPDPTKGLSFGMFIYLMLYVLFFWGIILVLYKNVLVSYEASMLNDLENNFHSTTIISKRAELDDLRAVLTHGRGGAKIKDSVLVQILLFLIDHCLVTQTSERVIEIFSRRMDTLQKHVESSYSLLRYIAWAIPSLGFIGTVLGIGAALAQAGMAVEDIELVTKPLGMAFDTTLIALLESIVLMFFMHSMQHKEEALLNSIDLFCQEKFIINLRLTK